MVVEELTYLLDLQAEAAKWNCEDGDNGMELEVKYRIKELLASIPDFEKTPIGAASKCRETIPTDPRRDKTGASQKQASARYQRKLRLKKAIERDGYTLEDELLDNENYFKIFEDGKYIARISAYCTVEEYRQAIAWLPEAGDEQDVEN